MNKIAKTALMTGAVLCVSGIVLSVAGYFAGGKDFTYASDHFYVSGGNSSEKDLAVMKKQQIEDFTVLNVDFSDLDLDIRTSEDDHYYMEYSLEKYGKKDPLIWEDKDETLTLKEHEGSTGEYYVNYDLGFLKGNVQNTEKQNEVNTVILYIPEKAQLDNAQIALADGDLTVDKLVSEKADVKLSSGDLILTEGGFEAFTAEFGDGDLTAGKFRADKLKIKNSNGDVSVKNAELKKTEIELGDGDFNMEGLQCTDNFRLESSSGDVDLKKAELGNGKISLGDGKLTMNGSRFDGDMDIRNSSGDVSVEMTAGSAENTNIYLKTSNGDIDTSGISTGSSAGDGEDYSMYESKAGEAAPTLDVDCGDGDITLTEAD